jgi:hypothetical protein
LDTLPPWREGIEKIEMHEASTLDAAIRTYAQRRRWPSLTTIQRCLLYYRFEHIESLLQSLAKSPVPAPGQFIQAVEWLLITNWYVHGAWPWMLRVEHDRWALQIADLGKPWVFPLRPEDGFSI